MSESARTIVYAGVAVASVVAAGLYGYVSRPAEVEGFDLVGSEFYPDFKDPAEASSLKVAAFDEDTATIRTFLIEQKSPGQWVIPTHYDYPADARERLNKTANSIIGIVRGPQKARRESEYKEYGVLDPLDEDLSELEGRGKRITLKKADGTTLADYIIGDKVGDEGNRYYVRTPREKEVYIAEIDVDLSTKFSDWIEDDLLKLERNDLREIIVNKYSIDETRGVITDQEVNTLAREKSFDPWKLEGLNEETEELRTTEINDMVDALDDLKIVGVRRKPKGLNPDLTVSAEVGRNPLLMQAIIGELQDKGFFVQGGENPKIYANEGNVMAATSEGVVYTLNFGEIFSGSDTEIEIGKSDEKNEESADDALDEKQSRYLFVTATFDEKYLGDKPTPPEKPVRPEGLKEEAAEQPGEGTPELNSAKPADAPVESSQEDKTAKESEDGSGCGSWQDEQKSQEAGKTADQSGDQAKTDDNSAQEKAETESGTAQEKQAEPETTPAQQQPGQEKSAVTQEGANSEGQQTQEPAQKPETEEEKQARLQAEWEQAQREYDAAVKKYEADLKDYEKKVEDGRKKAEDLNYRFAEWYYVISNESFQTLRLARTDLVKPKEKADTSATTPALPGNTPPAGNPEPASDQKKQPSSVDGEKEAAADQKATPDTAEGQKEPEKSKTDDGAGTAEPKPSTSTPPEKSGSDGKTDPAAGKQNEEKGSGQ